MPHFAPSVPAGTRCLDTDGAWVAGGFTGSVTNMTISGSTTLITSLAFDGPGTTAFYTTAGSGGTGTFGVATVGATSISTAVKQSGLLAAHGMIFDTYTGWLTLFGDTMIAQIDPTDPTNIVASLNLAGENGFSWDFDQGTSDGLGHLWAASNNGNVTFFDLTSCAGGKVDAAGCFRNTQFLKANLDDMAPLAGLGGCAPNCQTPEPASVALVLPALAGLLLMSRRRRQQTWQSMPS